MNKKTNKRKENNGITSIEDGRNADMGLKKNPKPARMANLELLRCVAMMMVIVLHYLGKGGMLSDLTGAAVSKAETAAWLLESFCIVAVNVYMFISGYFLCTSSFKVSRLIQLWLQIWAYSVGVGLIGALTGVLQETAFDTHYLLTLLFPVTMGHYWFMTAYVFLYLLLPFVGMAVKKMTKGQMQAALGILLLAFCVSKSILPVQLEMDRQGYDCLWYLCVFVAAAYVRRFGSAFLERKGRGLLLYAGCCLLVFGGTFALREVYLRTGGLERRIKMCLEYNHVLPFLAAAGLFGAFCRVRLRGRAADMVNRIAPYTLGVYLLHENLGLRYTWQKWLGAEGLAAAVGNADSGFGAVGSLFLWTGAAVLAVFACGILVDVARKGIFDGVHRICLKMGWYRKLMAVIERADALFR
ncbi:acyltransferase [uncultured Acetatifactor sp.]|uniref:acyltransferase n=1 Tax=uncultured Acetatifactor sp. TaxID=1671927 RepID=UPI00260955EE|nr:acyltransferase [uncultured Acetatifactor sp.]